MFPDLDEATKQALDSLSDDDLSWKRSYAYSHEIMWYGVHAVVHAVLMAEARAAFVADDPIEDFFQEFNLKMERSIGPDKLVGGIEPIIETGVFIPRKAFNWPNPGIWYFNPDYGNRHFNLRELPGGTEAIDLSNAICIRKYWSLADFTQYGALTAGSKFAFNLWRSAVYGFHISKKSVAFEGTNYHRDPLPEHIREPAEKLVAYYDGIMRELTDLSHTHNL